MKMVGHQTEAIYRRYAIAEEAMLRGRGRILVDRGRIELPTPGFSVL
jgi:hypothetical protein